MISKFRLPQFFNVKVQKQMGQLYGSTALADMAIAMIVIFEPIYLYTTIGLSVEQILGFFAVVYITYALIIPFGAKLISKIGLSRGILISVPFQVGYWACLLFADNSFLLYLAPVLLAIEKSVFWPAFHTIVGRFSNQNQVGREFSFLISIGSIVQIIGPFIGGFIALNYGISYTFIVACAIYAMSVVPLLFSKDLKVAFTYDWKTTWQLYKSYPKRFLGYLGFGEELLVLTIWPLFIYLYFSNYEQTGLIVTVAGIGSAVIALSIGQLSDKNSKNTLLRTGTFIYYITWVSRVLIANPASVFFAEIISRASKKMLFIPLSALTYERAEEKDVMAYVVGFEQVLAVGKAVGACVGIVAFGLTGSFGLLFVLAGLFCLFYLLV